MSETIPDAILAEVFHASLGGKVALICLGFSCGFYYLFNAMSRRDPDETGTGAFYLLAGLFGMFVGVGFLFDLLFRM